MIQKVKHFCMKHRRFLLKLLLDIVLYVARYLTNSESK